MKSTDYRNLFLDKVLGNTDFAPVASYWVALYTVAPTEGGGGTEVSGGGYARVEVTNDDTSFPDAVSGAKSNGTLIDFGTASALWGTIVAFGLHEHITDDALVIWGVLDTPTTVDSGDPAAFQPGDMQFTET